MPCTSDATYSRSSIAPSSTSPPRWTPAGCAAATPASSPCSLASTVTGIATDPEALRAVGWQPTAAELRRLRTELRAFLRAALTP